MAELLTEPIEIYRDDYIRVLCMDEKGAGGAHHVYRIYENGVGWHHEPLLEIKHQEGPILENGVNGITNEALLAICEHRMECFQNGPFPCDENKTALKGIREALGSLLIRTEKRKQRGVEGKSES